MKHYVLLKFEPDYFSEEVLKYTKNVYYNIEEQVKGIQSIQVFGNFIKRDINMDIMVEINLENKDVLKIYLEHELHKAYSNTVKDHIVLRVSFDRQ